MMRAQHAIAALLISLVSNAWAQSAAEEQPAVSTSGAAEEPAVQTTPEAAPAAEESAAPAAAPAKATARSAAAPAVGDGKNNEGTTIIGERESPIGLYITPWHNAAAETDIDRPARLLSVGLEVLDRRVFARQVEYYEALTEAQKAKSEGAPPASSAKPAP